MRIIDCKMALHKMIDFGKFDFESKNHLVCVLSWTLSLLGCTKVSEFKNMASRFCFRWSV